jgi:hypothetical protein
MAPRTLLLAFTPLIAFSVLARFLPPVHIGVTALAGAVLALAAEVAIRPVWPPNLLSCCSLILFTLIAVLGFTQGQGTDSWLATWGGAGLGLALGLALLALLPVRPFTEQFARETTPRAYWSSPTFRKVNRVLSTAWGVAICAVGVSRVTAAAVSHSTFRLLPELLLGLIVPVAIIASALGFSRRCYQSIQ